MTFTPGTLTTTLGKIQPGPATLWATYDADHVVSCLGNHPPPASPGVTAITARLLIVNADDFGLTPGICQGVLRAFESGVVSSTSALAVGPAFPTHARDLEGSGLPVGAHLAVVGEDPPILSAKEIPTLVDDQGRFPLRWPSFVRRALRGGIDTDDLRREFLAQIEVLEEYDLRLTHLDSHQNLHLWPQVATALIELAVDRSIPAMRLTRTARWGPVSLGVRTLSARLRQRAVQKNLLFPAASSGLDEAGALDRGRFLQAIEQLGQSGATSAELVTHLALDHDPERARYVTGYRWGEELAAACDPAVRAAIERSGFTLGSYADLR